MLNVFIYWQIISQCRVLVRSPSDVPLWPVKILKDTRCCLTDDAWKSLWQFSNYSLHSFTCK